MATAASDMRAAYASALQLEVDTLTRDASLRLCNHRYTTVGGATALQVDVHHRHQYLCGMSRYPVPTPGEMAADIAEVAARTLRSLARNHLLDEVPAWAYIKAPPPPIASPRADSSSSPPGIRYVDPQEFDRIVSRTSAP